MHNLDVDTSDPLQIVPYLNYLDIVLGAVLGAVLPAVLGAVLPVDHGNALHENVVADNLTIVDLFAVLVLAVRVLAVLVAAVDIVVAGCIAVVVVVAGIDSVVLHIVGCPLVVLVRCHLRCCFVPRLQTNEKLFSLCSKSKKRRRSNVVEIDRIVKIS